MRLRRAPRGRYPTAAAGLPFRAAKGEHGPDFASEDRPAMNENLLLRFLPQLERDPARPVLTWQGAPVTAGWLLERMRRLASVLRAAGASGGERIAVQVEKSPEAVALYLAALQTGAIYLPLNTAYTAAELAHFLGDAEPRLVVADPAGEAALAPLTEAAGARLTFLDAAGRGPLAEAADAASPDPAIAIASRDDIAAILYTSGTTGRSKGAMLSHGNLAANIEALIEAWDYRESDILIHALPLFHTHGLFVALGMTLAAGASAHLLPKFDADAVVSLMPRSTVLMGVPTFYARLLAHPGLDRAAAGMRLFISGSAPLMAETHRAFAERTGHAILERYGMTETGMNISNPLHGERRPGSVGLPLPGVEVRVTGRDGHPLPLGEVGNIEVRGPNVFRGYWRMPEKTREDFRPDGFFVTGDLGFVDRDGYYTIVGRSKDLIISGGLNVYPKEIEDVLNAVPGIAESAVIGVPHPDFGEAVVALVRAEGPQPDLVSRAGRAAEAALAPFKRPKRILVVDDFPRNAMGKVQKNILRERFRDALG
jgi:malonyl-CoA/methylmalonyl-CoA synthetase